MPITIDKNIKWTSILPGNVVGSVSLYLSFFQSIDHRFNQIKGSYQLSEDNKYVEGKIKLNRHEIKTKITFHEIKGFKEIEVIDSKKHVIMSIVED